MSSIPHIDHAEVDRSAGAGADAASSLYARFSGQIYGYCLHQLGSREEAEDALQTTFMNAFRGLQRGIVPKIESAWLFKIAHNVCLSRRRSTWRRGRVEAPNNLEVLQEIVPARERKGDELIGLQDALDLMPEGQRRAILLREWQGLSYREIAAELGVSQAAVETLIFRARRALAQGLEEPPDEPCWRRRARHGLDGGAMLTALKAFFTGSTAVKIAATAAVVATTTAVATSETARHHARAQRASSPTTARTQDQAVSLAPAQPVLRPQRRVAASAPRLRAGPAMRSVAARASSPAPAPTSTSAKSAPRSLYVARPGPKEMPVSRRGDQRASRHSTQRTSKHGKAHQKQPTAHGSTANAKPQSSGATQNYQAGDPGKAQANGH